MADSTEYDVDQIPATFRTTYADLLVEKRNKNPALGISNAARRVMAQVMNFIEGVMLALLARVSGTSLNVREYGAVGNGTTDDTTAVQAALDAAIALGRGASVYFPPGTYLCGNLTIANATGLTVHGYGATLQWTGTAAGSDRIGIQLSGTVEDVTVKHLRLRGNGVEADRHAGVWMGSGQTLSNVTYKGLRVENMTLGLSFNSDTSGSTRDCSIRDCHIEDVVGIDSGYGYGIHLADGTDEPARILIRGNTIVRAQRHSIYMARGHGFAVTHNKIDSHRDGTTDGAVRAAILCGRGGDHIIAHNVITNSNNCCIMVDAGDTSGETGRNIVVENNSILDPVVSGSMIACIYVGEDLTTPSDEISGVVVRGNTIRAGAGWNQTAIKFNWGKGVIIADNRIRLAGVTATTYGITIQCRGESAFSTTYSDRLVFRNNDIFISDGGGGSASTAFRFNTPSNDVAGSSMLFDGNRWSVPAANGFSTSASVSNPNVTIANQLTGGLTMASGVALLGFPVAASSVTVSGDMTFSGASSAILLGSTTSSGNAQVRFDKGDANNQTGIRWNNAGSVSWAEQHDTAENLNTLNSSSAVVGGWRRTTNLLYTVAGLLLGSTSGPTISSGSGTPEGAVTAPVGSLFVRTDGGANTTLYVKESGSGNTGWVAK